MLATAASTACEVNIVGEPPPGLVPTTAGRTILTPGSARAERVKARQTFPLQVRTQAAVATASVCTIDWDQLSMGDLF